VGILLVGRLGDIFGRRYFLIGGQLLGLIGAIVCATAKNIPTVIGGSALCGLAAAVQLTFTFVIAELVPNRLRPMVNAGIFITTFPFAAFGGLIAQLFIANTEKSWRWTYYLNIITCSLSMILLVICYFPPGWDRKHMGASKIEGLKKFDYIGFILYAGGLILVLLGLCKFLAASMLFKRQQLTNFHSSLGWYFLRMELCPCCIGSRHWICGPHCLCGLWYAPFTPIPIYVRIINTFIRDICSSPATPPAHVTAETPWV
jgi:MFS family permease